MAAQTLDRDLVLQPGHNDLTVQCLRGGVHREQIPVQDAGIPHAATLHPQQEVGPGAEQAGIDGMAVLNMLDGQDRAASGYPPDHRQAALLLETGTLPRPVLQEPDPPGTSAGQLDDPMPRQGP
jgi:hypothetical protein